MDSKLVYKGYVEGRRSRDLQESLSAMGYHADRVRVLGFRFLGTIGRTEEPAYVGKYSFRKSDEVTSVKVALWDELSEWEQEAWLNKLRYRACEKPYKRAMRSYRLLKAEKAVYHKNGRLRITIESRTERGYIYCVWKAGRKNPIARGYEAEIVEAFERWIGDITESPVKKIRKKR